MRKVFKLVLGIFTLWPTIYMVIFIFTFFNIFLTMMGLGNINERRLFTLFGMHIITVLLMFILITIYLVNVYRNNSVDKDKKLLWTILILFGGIIAMPIYWYLFIWKEPSQSED